MGIEPETFFVLRGFVNGERGMYAVPAGGLMPTDRRMEDGWYYHVEGDPDGVGPFPCREDAEEASQARAKMEDLDVGEIIKALLSGHLAPMPDGIRQAYLDAGPHALYGKVGEFSVVVDFQADGTVHCEACLGGDAALVDLAGGTWQRI